MRSFDSAMFAYTVLRSLSMPNSWFSPQVLRQYASSLIHLLNSVIVIVSRKAIWLWIQVPNVFVRREFGYRTTSSSDSITLPIVKRLFTRPSKTRSFSSRELFELTLRWYRRCSGENFRCLSFRAWTCANSSQVPFTVLPWRIGPCNWLETVKLMTHRACSFLSSRIYFLFDFPASRGSKPCLAIFFEFYFMFFNALWMEVFPLMTFQTFFSERSIWHWKDQFW